MQAAGCVNLVYNQEIHDTIPDKGSTLPELHYMLFWQGIFVVPVNIFIQLFVPPPGGGMEVTMVKENVAGFHYELYKNCLVIYVTQDLDHHAVLSLRERSDRLIEAGDVKHVIFDFKDVGFMDSSGIGLLMGRYKKVMFLGGRAAVTSVGSAVDRIFKISGLYKIIEKYDTPGDAIKALEVKYEDYI